MLGREAAEAPPFAIPTPVLVPPLQPVGSEPLPPRIGFVVKGVAEGGFVVPLERAPSDAGCGFAKLAEEPAGQRIDVGQI